MRASEIAVTAISQAHAESTRVHHDNQRVAHTSAHCVQPKPSLSRVAVIPLPASRDSDATLTCQSGGLWEGKGKEGKGGDGERRRGRGGGEREDRRGEKEGEKRDGGEREGMGGEREGGRGV